MSRVGSSIVAARACALGRWCPCQNRRLAPRFGETLHGMMDGLSEKQTAIRLGVSPHTVHVYVKLLYKIFDVSSRGELLTMVLRRYEVVLAKYYEIVPLDDVMLGRGYVPPRDDRPVPWPGRPESLQRWCRLSM